MRRFALTMTLAGAALFATTPVGAQGRGRGNGGVPPGHRPPPGMCRIWIDGVPAGQQPAPTDCASAVRNRPSNGRVLFGDDAGGRSNFRGKGRGNGGGYGNGDYDDRDDNRDDRGTTTSGGGKWSDILRGGTNTCVDANRDGRCDPNDASGSTLPDMAAAILIGRGQRTSDVNRWLGGTPVVARLANVGRNGVPGRVMWYDQAGQLVQVWTDHDGDGRADRVEEFQNGRRVRVIGQ